MKTNRFLNYSSLTDTSIRGSVRVDDTDESLQEVAKTVIKAFFVNDRISDCPAELWLNVGRIIRDQKPFVVIRKRRVDEADGQWEFRVKSMAKKHDDVEISPSQIIRFVEPFEILSELPEFGTEIEVTWRVAEGNTFPFN